jgi:predicted double-glycine peptidase
LKIALSAFGIDKTEEELAALSSAISAPDAHRMGGTEHEGMVAAAKALNLQVFTKEESTLEDIAYFLEEEHLPVIVGWFDRDDDHYSVAIELTDTDLVLADSSSEGPIRNISRELFPSIWFDFIGAGNHRVSWGWLMVVTPDKREFKIEGGTYH